MTPHAPCFPHLHHDSTTVVTADGKRLQSLGKGTVILMVDQTSNTGELQQQELTLFDVLLVPGLEFSLLSVYKLNEDHLRVEFTEQLEAIITDPFHSDLLVSALWSRESQAYVIAATHVQAVGNTAFVIVEEETNDAFGDEEMALPAPNDQEIRHLETWHERLGHLGKSALHILAKNSTGLPGSLSKRSKHCVSDCETCSLTNIKRSPFPSSTTKTTRALELVHADLTGRIIVPSLGGAEYAAVLVDDYTRYMWVLLLKRKSDFCSNFIKWRDEVVPFKGAIACLRTDGGGEFDNASLRAALSGARHEKSCAYTAQQNGVAERYVGILKAVMRPLLHGRQLPLQYWGEAATTAAYLRNRSPSTALGGKTPFELWTSSAPNLSDLRVFGCLAFAMLSDRAREHSLALRARPGVFVGYDKERKGYRVQFPDTGDLVITRNVDFHESKGYDFAHSTQPSESTLPLNVTVSTSTRPAGVRPRLVVIGPRPPPPATPATATVEELPQPASGSHLPSAPHTSSVEAAPATVSPVSPASLPARAPAPAPAAAPAAAPTAAPDAAPPAAPAAAPAAVPAAHPPRAPREPRPIPSRQHQTRSHVQRLEQGRQQRASAGTVLDLSHSFAAAFKAQLSADGVEIEPDTLKDAMRRADWSKWLEAMRAEMLSHEEMGTWVLEPLPDGADVVGCRWVFKLKLDASGKVLRYKARLVAQGFTQTHGVNYHETYSPVTRFTTIRTLLALAAYLGWHVHQLDVVTAYLYGRLKETVYMRQPIGFEVQGQVPLVCRLIRALYGLKQSGREWYLTLRTALTEFGFEQSTVDPAIFIYGQGPSALIVAVYVDDLLVFGQSLDDINAFKSTIGQKFKMTDQGNIGQFLGMNIERSEDGRSFLISQTAYIKSVLQRFDFPNMSAKPSPLDPKQRLTPFDGQASQADLRLYQAIIGCLLWLALASRPDLCFAVAALARHSKNPGPVHFGCLKRALRYVAGTAGLKLRIAAHSEDDITAFSDADFGGDSSAKSTSGWCVSVHGGTVAWGAKLQTLIADSTAQAELVAVWQTSREVLAIRNFLEDLGMGSSESASPTIIYCDNKPAIHIICNPVSSGVTRHMERKYLSTRQHQERGLIDVRYINTRANPADMFTKALVPNVLSEHRHTIGLSEHPGTSSSSQQRQ